MKNISSKKLSSAKKGTWKYEIANYPVDIRDEKQIGFAPKSFGTRDFCTLSTLRY